MLLKLLCLVAMVAAVPVPDVQAPGAPADEARVIDCTPHPQNRVARSPEEEPTEEQPHEESADAHAPLMSPEAAPVLRQAPSGSSSILGWIPYQSFFSGLQSIPTQIQSQITSLPGISSLQGIPGNIQSSISGIPGLSSLTSSLPSLSSIPGLSNVQSSLSGIPLFSWLGGSGSSGKVLVPVVRSPYLVYAAYPTV
ncbi:hypothetical protein O0L34_g16298 [Tuta absoluta]|nr:hypothetical protein O0L34_g16298 [Tuta absoluta]